MDAKLRTLLPRALMIVGQQQGLLQEVVPLAQEMERCLREDRKPSPKETARWTEALVRITQTFDSVNQELAWLPVYASET